jgi:hypothetical protein
MMILGFPGEEWILNNTVYCYRNGYHIFTAWEIRNVPGTGIMGIEFRVRDTRTKPLSTPRYTNELLGHMPVIMRHGLHSWLEVCALIHHYSQHPPMLPKEVMNDERITWNES